MSSFSPPGTLGRAAPFDRDDDATPNSAVSPAPVMVQRLGSTVVRRKTPAGWVREPPKADATKLAETQGWVKLAAEEQMPFAAAVALDRLMGLLGHAFGWHIEFILGAPAAGKTAEQFLSELNQAPDADQPT